MIDFMTPEGGHKSRLVIDVKRAFKTSDKIVANQVKTFIKTLYYRFNNKVNKKYEKEVAAILNRFGKNAVKQSREILRASNRIATKQLYDSIAFQTRVNTVIGGTSIKPVMEKSRIQASILIYANIKSAHKPHFSIKIDGDKYKETKGGARFNYANTIEHGFIKKGLSPNHKDILKWMKSKISISKKVKDDVLTKNKLDSLFDKKIDMYIKKKKNNVKKASERLDNTKAAIPYKQKKIAELEEKLKKYPKPVSKEDKEKRKEHLKEVGYGIVEYTSKIEESIRLKKRTLRKKEKSIKRLEDAKKRAKDLYEASEKIAKDKRAKYDDVVKRLRREKNTNKSENIDKKLAPIAFAIAKAIRNRGGFKTLPKSGIKFLEKGVNISRKELFKELNKLKVDFINENKKKVKILLIEELKQTDSRFYR